MLNISVLSGGILPLLMETGKGHALDRWESWYLSKEACKHVLKYFSFFAIAQGRRNGELSLLSHTHSLQALVPAFENLQYAQGEPDGLAIVMFVSGMKQGAILF